MLLDQTQKLCLLSSLELPLGGIQSDRQNPSLAKKPKQTIKLLIIPTQPGTGTEENRK